VRKNANISEYVISKSGTIGIRIPSHPIAIELLKKLDIPITSTSANISGNPSPLTAEMVHKQLGKKVAFIIDDGQTKLKEVSTIIDLSEEVPVLIRDGAISIETLEKIIGKIHI
jgi:L-threonylcarbamoyladenylate synthase